MNKRIMASFLLLVMLIGIMDGCKKNIAAPELKTPASESVQGILAERKDIANITAMKGNVTGKVKCYYYNQFMDGLQYKVQLGEKVLKGQELVVADTEELESMLEDLNRELEEVKGKLSYQKEYSQLNQKRIKLQGQNADQKGKEEAQRELEKEKIDEEYQRSLLEIEIANINKQIAEVQEQIENCTLYAEEDGYVSYISYEESSLEFYNILAVTNTDSLCINAEYLVEDYIRAYVYYDGKEWELNEIPYSDMEKKAAERNGMTIGSKFELPTESMVLGDYLELYFVLEESRDAIVISKSCIYSSEDMDYVYRIHGENKEKCFIEKGIDDGSEVQITSGIEEGDLIFYPIDETIEYEGTAIVTKESVPIMGIERSCYLSYPYQSLVTTRIAESELQYLTEATELKKGDLIATVKVLRGEADVKEIENQISTLKKQYDIQNDMHEKVIKDLNEEIKKLKEKKKEQKNKSKGEKQENIDLDEEQEDLSKIEEQENGDGEPEEDSVSEEDISIKELELSMEKMSKAYEEDNYKIQLKGMEKKQKHLKESTGEVSIYSSEEVEFERFYVEKGSRLVDGSVLGIMHHTDTFFWAVRDGDNILPYGMKVVIKDADENEYEGEVIGTYPSGEATFTQTDESGTTFTYTVLANENQGNVYIRLKENIELKNGTLVYQSNMLEDAIVIDMSLLKKEKKDFYVWVLREGKPYKQYVQFDNLADDKLLIYKGLSENDTLLMGVK